MANELVISSLNVAFAKANVPSVSLVPTSLSIAVAGTNNMDNVQNIGTIEEAILLGDVATGGYMFAQNLDTTNFVHLRGATGGTNFIKLLAGEWCIFRCSASASAPFAIADTAACNVRFLRFAL